MYLNFGSLSSTKPLLAFEWRNNFCSESQNHVLVMHIIAHFLSNCLKISRSSDNENQTGEEEEGHEAGAEGGVKVDEEQ